MVKVKTIKRISAPDDHFAAGPHCRVTVGSGFGRVGGTWSRPSVADRIVSTARIEQSVGAAITAAPDNHFAAGPDCCVPPSGSGRSDGAGGCPTVGAGVLPSAGIEIHAGVLPAAPDDHFTAGPDC